MNKNINTDIPDGDILRVRLSLMTRIEEKEGAQYQVLQSDTLIGEYEPVTGVLFSWWEAILFASSVMVNCGVAVMVREVAP